jgi:hypothetical protein
MFTVYLFGGFLFLAGMLLLVPLFKLGSGTPSGQTPQDLKEKASVMTA